MTTAPRALRPWNPADVSLVRHNPFVRNLKTIMSDGAQRVRKEQQAVEERLDARIRGLASLSDEQLIAQAPARTPVAFPWHEMEMQRRLKDSIEALTREASRARWWAFWGRPPSWRSRLHLSR